MNMTAFAAGCAAVACLIGTAQAQTTTYDYTGALMNGTLSSDMVPPNGMPGTIPYCCASFDGAMTLSSPLAANLNNALIDPTAFTISLVPLSTAQYGGEVSPFNTGAGGTLYNSNPTGSSFYNLLATAHVSTNNAGQLTEWDLSMNIGPTGQAGTIASSGDAVSSFTSTTSIHVPVYNLSNAIAGNWTVAGGGSAAAAPEINPAGAITAITLLLGLIAVVRGTRRSKLGVS